MKPNWEHSSHKDVSVLLWKAYLQSAIDTPSVEQDHPNTIERMFRKLQEEEIVGININESWLEDITVYLEEIPQEYKSDNNIVKCLNYPDLNGPRCSHFQSNNMDMFGLV